MVVDTGTDDAGALIWAATDPRVDLVAVVADWGNVGVERATRNTLAVLRAAGANDVPVYSGAGKGSSGPSPARFDASVVMGEDGLNGVVLPDGEQSAQGEPGHEALVRLASERPGELTLVPVSPFTPVAAALQLDPQLPSRLFDIVVMGGAIATAGNLTPGGEANVANDPDAAAAMVEAFGVPGVLSSGRTPRMVPLDATHDATISLAEVELAGASSISGAAALEAIWRASFEFSALEGGDGLPIHDLLAALVIVEPDICEWHTLPLEVDCAGGPAWGMTVGDQRMALVENSPWPDEEKERLAELIGFASSRWDVAMSADVDRFRAALRSWLTS